MRMKTLLGILVIGGAAYFHKKRGGEFTFSSIKESVRDLVRSLGVDKLVGSNPEQKKSRGSDVGARHGGMRSEAGENGIRGGTSGMGRDRDH